MHADCVRAHTETYKGLVEFGVGIIPSGGGTKEMTLRTSDVYKKGDPELNVLMENFMTIATAKVATSSKEAVEMGLLRNTSSTKNSFYWFSGSFNTKNIKSYLSGNFL